jgi:hypothetical protein
LATGAQEPLHSATGKKCAMSMAVPQKPAPITATRASSIVSSPLAGAVAVYLIALAWTCLVRLPLLSADCEDNANFTWIAHAWLRGALPYVGAFDVKPPGLFALLGLSELAFGPTLEAMRALAIASDAATATGLFFLARKFGDAKVGVFAAALYPVIIAIAISYDAVSPLAAFTVLAFWAALSNISPMGRAALAGLLIGAAATIKQTAAFEALALAWIVTSASDAAGRRGRTVLAFAVGASVAPLGFLAYFALHGAAGVLVEDSVVAALLRPASDMEGVSFFGGLARFLPLQKTLLPLTALCVSAAMRRRALQKAAPGLPLSALFGWLAAACAGLILQRALYVQYLAPALAPALLIAGFCAARALTELSRIAPALRLLALAALTILCIQRAPAADIFHVRSQELSALRTAAEAIRARDPRPTAALYVVNRGLWLNNMLDLAPPTKYVFPIHALCPFLNLGAGVVEENLAAQPRFIVVADPRVRAVCEQPDRWRLIDDALARDYRRLAHVAGERDAFDVYERTDGWELRP